MLREHCGEGRLTLEEFAERLDVVLQARTRGELDVVVRDLPVEPLQPAPPARTAVRRRFVAILSSAKSGRRWRVPEQMDALAILGDCKLDLRDAVFDGTHIELTAVAVLGDVKITVPRGMAVEISGMTILGETKCRIDDRELLPGMPVVHLRAFSVLGDVKVISGT